jgi:hypothetical protein
MPWKYYLNYVFIVVAFVVAVGGIIWGSVLISKHEEGAGLLVGAIAFLGIAIIGTIRQYGFSGNVSTSEIKSVIAISLDDGLWSWVSLGLAAVGIVFFIALRPPSVTTTESTSTASSQIERSAPAHASAQAGKEVKEPEHK